MNKLIILNFFPIFFIIIPLTLSSILTNTAYIRILFVYAQTNANLIATSTYITDNSINNDNNIMGFNNNHNNKSVISNLNSLVGDLQINTHVKYFDNASGYLVYPSNATVGTTPKKLPGIIMIHEWWGLNDNIKTMANILAKQAGYVVLAVDLFEGQSTTDQNQAMQLVTSVINNPQQSISNLQSAVKYLDSLPFVDKSKIASIGWCFGGGQSLQLALHSEQHPLAGTVLYYGTPLVTDKQDLSKIKWPLLGIFGDKDQNIPLSQINSFKFVLDSLGIKNQIFVYKGLGHAFANPSGPNYAPQQTTDAWEKTLTFFRNIFDK